MLSIGNVVLDSIATRIHRGLTVDDVPAKELKPGRNGHRGYPDYKSARGLQPFRDWFWTGRTMRSLKVKQVSENRCVIGFIDPNADTIAHMNNRRQKQFGVSPRDREALTAVVRAVLKQSRVIQVRRAA
jgi:hypothetical protein